MADRQKEQTEKSEVTHTEVAQESDNNNAIILPSPVKATKLLHQQFGGDALLTKHAHKKQKSKKDNWEERPTELPYRSTFIK